MMSKLVFSLILIVTLVSLPAIAASNTPQDDWGVVVANGIRYQEYHLDTPNNVFVARMDRSNPDAIIQSGLAQGRLNIGRETVSEMAKRYDESINYWGETWGNRSKVAVAINGSYFDKTTLMPLAGMVQDGWYAKWWQIPTQDYTGSGFAWKLDRSAFIGPCVTVNPSKQKITFLRDGATFPLNGVNQEQDSDYPLVMYTPQYDDVTPRSGVKLTQILVRVDRPVMVMPAPRGITGTIESVSLDTYGSTQIPFDAVVLSVRTRALRDEVKLHAVVGSQVLISEEITDVFYPGCPGKYDVAWNKTYASMAGNEEYLINGQIRTFTNPGSIARNPRTAIAFNDDYIYFIVVDGRSSRSVGMTIDELAHFTQDVLGATWAINQDGGGSSTMVVNNYVMNSPSDPCKRTFVPNVSKSGEAAPQNKQSGEAYPPPYPTCQRYVLNSMMMANVEPREISGVYSNTVNIVATGATNVRLGPGTNYAVIQSVPGGTLGEIVSHPLNGVLAKGYNWWKVKFETGLTGWVSETNLAGRK